MKYKVNLLAEYSLFEFRIFYPLDQLPDQGQRFQFALIFTHGWLTYVFPKSIRTKGNSNSLIQNLIPSRRIYFLWWWPFFFIWILTNIFFHLFYCFLLVFILYSYFQFLQLLIVKEWWSNWIAIKKQQKNLKKI